MDNNHKNLATLPQDMIRKIICENLEPIDILNTRASCKKIKNTIDSINTSNKLSMAIIENLKNLKDLNANVAEIPKTTNLSLGDILKSVNADLTELASYQAAYLYYKDQSAFLLNMYEAPVLSFSMLKEKQENINYLQQKEIYDALHPQSNFDIYDGVFENNSDNNIINESWFGNL